MNDSGFEEYRFEFWLGEELDENGEPDDDDVFGWSVIAISPDSVEEGQIPTTIAEAFVVGREPYTGAVDPDVAAGRQYVYNLSRDEVAQLIGDEELAAYDLLQFREVIGIGPVEDSNSHG